ncbi:MAG TPA: GDSL-type esterase/lipase family protein [Bryobacteraceae bacterium]|nr:GDSL-type esterase/lipase family protein [Bryobacteraceae bacterium]
MKTTLAILTFIGLILLPRVAPALRNYESFDPQNVRAVVDLPVPKLKDQGENDPARLAEARVNLLESRAPAHLSDPQRALDHFYESLLKGATTHILHYGDSPTTGDLITADARAMLQKEFGDGGSGFVLIARPWAWYNHRGVEMEASSWKIDIAGIATTKDGMHGLGGVSFFGTPGATAEWRLRSSHPDTIEAAYLSQPGGGSFTMDADGQELGAVDTAATAKAPGYASFKIPRGATKFTLRVKQGTVRLYGAEFLKGAGVMYSSLGINGANVTLLSRSFNERHWATELRHYKPDLVIVNYGTNESGFAQFVDKTWAPEMKEVVRRIRAALPETSILLMSPMDRGERTTGGEIETVPELPHLVDIESQVAHDTGAAFFNTYEAMGGAGTMGRWYAAEPRLVGADFIHPMPAGAKIVGELLYNALRDGYNQYKLRQLKATSTTAALEEK